MELRWDPILSQWIIVSGKRGVRPLLPEGYCPFCPGADEVPGKGWTVLSLPNKFPALRPDAPPPDVKFDRLYRCRRAEGICEVIVYTPEHNTSLSELSVENIKAVIDLWRERFEELQKLEYVKYVFIFENKGRIIGVTLDHPHGQLYAFPFVPPIIQRELSSSRNYLKRTGKCLFCKIIEKEKEDKVRVVCENKDFICFLPFFAHWPFGVHIYPKRHIQAIIDLTEEEKWSFASILKSILRKFDNLYDMSFPYMMALHQRPTDGKDYPYYHFHVEFYPPYREKGKIKYFAGVETGAGTVTYDYTPEMKAEELRKSPED
ncbi:MAG: galactose-1-phosphate uridylyltransferase [Nitrososphaerota archaeon]|nr:galactose-1-phosphate uridylyltransferase [Candidatus Bathyarchaeota archaeon]MDW8048951.1 galactose-1-phosphate uridylyltransferase [Nitrososphaerota archaeon]